MGKTRRTRNQRARNTRASASCVRQVDEIQTVCIAPPAQYKKWQPSLYTSKEKENFHFLLTTRLTGNNKKTTCPQAEIIRLKPMMSGKTLKEAGVLHRLL